MDNRMEYNHDRRLSERASTNKKAKVFVVSTNSVFSAELMNISTGGYGIKVYTNSDLVGEEILIISDDSIDSCLTIRQSFSDEYGSFIGAKVVSLNKKAIFSFIQEKEKLLKRKEKASKRLKFLYYPGKFRLK